MVDGHRETWPVRSIRMRSWLRRKYYEATGAAAAAGAISSALDLLEARAQFDGPQCAIYLRVAERDGRIYLDLADERWRAVEIGPDGWQIITHPPVRFRRAAGMQPLPMPTRGGSLDALAPFFNVANRNDFVLIVAWLLAALRHGGPYPLLALSGEQGSAKTVLSKMLRGLIDPNAAPVRTSPREERDLFIAANNGHLLAFDNLSDLSPWMSDALCRLASGGSFAVRQLCTDRDEVLFQAARPIILNGIEDVITRPDLADRSIFLTLPHLAEERRRTEKEIWRDFETAQPRILGALLDAASHGLRALPEVRLEQLPRMADFGRFAEAEIVAPAAHIRSQLFHCRLDADALGPSRDVPDSLLEPFQRFRRDRALDVWTSREAEPEKLAFLRSCHRTLCLVDLELELLRDEARDALHHPLTRAFATHVNVTVVRIANKAMSAALQLPVEHIEHEVTQQWRKRASLRSPFHARADQPVLHHPGIQECPDEFQQPLVLDALGDLAHQFVVIDSIEEFF